MRCSGLMELIEFFFLHLNYHKSVCRIYSLRRLDLDLPNRKPFVGCHRRKSTSTDLIRHSAFAACGHLIPTSSPSISVYPWNPFDSNPRTVNLSSAYGSYLVVSKTSSASSVPFRRRLLCSAVQRILVARRSHSPQDSDDGRWENAT